MVEQKQWRFEVKNPLTSDEWRPLWQIKEDDLVASHELRDALNKINAPIQLRVVSYQI